MKDKVHLRDCEELYSAPSLAGDELQPACTVPPLGSGMCHSSPCAPSQAALLPQPLLPTHPPRAPGAYLPTYLPGLPQPRGRRRSPQSPRWHGRTQPLRLPAPPPAHAVPIATTSRRRSKARGRACAPSGAPLSSARPPS